MGFTTVKAFTTESMDNGKVWETMFQKTTGLIHARGRWYLSLIHI